MTEYLVIYVYAETFLVCFSPNNKVPWSRPELNLNLTRFACRIAVSILIALNHKQREDDLILFIFIGILYNFNFIINWL